MTTNLDTLPLPAPSPESTLVRNFDTEFRLLEERIAARLRPRGFRDRLRTAIRFLATGPVRPAPYWDGHTGPQ